ncbi:DNA-binding CsgD family transcriptional regulator [Pseudorhizobium tarimense]|uniref:DNA-binding CsgD family transcriptional regulator n=1 Tax=Pseudorhizobium tarimense TaxID=1079109 RepID=A0ABV2H6T3_9HYPH|nr:LuxR C-terminal-related transcriptional regulator [Pseudorhizobium tarimense]MCJ8519407.1 LuxR C-terminal-related transcriptional regulator [Pseudorhizobium tarimense]
MSRTIAAATSRADVLSALTFAARAFDFSFVTLLVKPVGQDELLGRILVHTTLPSEYIQEYDQNRYLGMCPLVEHLFSSMLPRTWTIDAVERQHAGKLPSDLPRLLRRFGITTTAAMPLHSLEGERFLLRFDGSRPPLELPELNELGMIALHAFDVFEKFRRTERFSVPSPLSARELEVVRWTAQGKTSVEIGQILSLSDHTVNAHMTNAIKKLDCVNRTQLVAKAMRLGLIS